MCMHPQNVGNLPHGAGRDLMFPVVKAQGKAANTEHAHWCLDGGNALQNERFCGSVIHIDLLGTMVANHP